MLGASTGHDFRPLRHFGVARLRQQIQSVSSVGAVLTASDSPLDEAGRLSSVVGGVDWDLRFVDNTYSLEGFTTFSHRRWSGGDDAPETGMAASLQGSRRRGTWTYDLGLTVFDDKFNPNELGRLRQNNYINMNVGLDYQVNAGNAFGPFQRAFIFSGGGQGWSYDEGLNLGFGYRLFSRWTTRGFQDIGLNMRVENLFGGYDLYETRGLGPRAQPRSYEIGAEFSTDARRTWQIEPEVPSLSSRRMGEEAMR